MNFNIFSKKKANIDEQGQELQVRRKSWPSVFMLIIAAVLLVTFVFFTDELLLAETENIDTTTRYGTSYSTTHIKPNYGGQTTVKVSNRGTRTSSATKTSDPDKASYQFICDSGYTLLLLSFQEKEVFSTTDSLESSIRKDYADTLLLSGYTVTNAFETLDYREGMNWASLGKIYGEYGTLGLTGVDGKNKQTLISDIIETDFPDATNLDNLGNIELLNGLAYRSNVLTDELLGRSMIYVPRDAAVSAKFFDVATNGWSSKSGNMYTYMAPWVYGLMNKQMALANSPDFRYGADINDCILDEDNWNSLATAMSKAFNPTNTYRQKQESAQYLSNAIAYAWPVMVNRTGNNTESTEYYGPLISISDSNKVTLTGIKPGTTGEEDWATPFASNMYYVEDTLHQETAYAEDYDIKIANKLDKADELEKYATSALDEDALHEDLLEYYTNNPSMAYAVIDAVFGGIREDTLLVSTDNAHSAVSNPGNNVDWSVPLLYHFKFSEGFTENIDFEERLLDWLTCGIDNYAKEDPDRESRVAGIRQAQLNCALGFILQEMHGISVDTKSNIEIRLLNVYANQGIVNYDDEEYVQRLLTPIKEQGWGAWDTVLGLANSSYVTSYETIASNFYDYDRMAFTKHKMTTLASASVGYAKNRAFTIPTVDNTTITVGGAGGKTDIVLSALAALGKTTYKYEIEDNSVVYDSRGGADSMYAPSYDYSTDSANLGVTDELRQAYLCTVYARGSGSSSGKIENVYNYRGLLNIGFVRETGSAGTAFTGIYDSSGYGINPFYSDSYSVKKIERNGYYQYRLCGVSKYAISLENLMPSDTGNIRTVIFPFNNVDKTLWTSTIKDGKNQDTAKGLVTTAGSFLLKTTHSGVNRIMVLGTNADGSEPVWWKNAYTPDTVKLNRSGEGTYYGNFDRTAFLNIAAQNTLKTAFTTYSPSADTLTQLNEENTSVIEAAQNNATVANGNFFYLYNRTYYKKAEEIEVHAVLGFRPSDSKEKEVTHMCAPADVKDHNVTLGLNFSKASLEAMLQHLQSDGTNCSITISLGGIGDGSLQYFTTTGRVAGVKSKFDTSLLIDSVTNKNTFASGFGVLKYADSYDANTAYIKANNIKNQYYLTYMNRFTGPYITDIKTDNSQTAGKTIRITVDRKDIEDLLALDEIADDPTCHLSDTKYMLRVAEWPAEFFAGENNTRLAAFDSASTLSTNVDYTAGVEINIAFWTEDASPDSPVDEIVLFDTGTLAEDEEYFISVGSGLYSGMYGSSAATKDSANTILIRRDKKLMSTPPKDQMEYCIRNTDYGEGTDNHVYLRFASPEVKQWKFDGTAGLRWVNSENPKLAGVEWNEGESAPTLGDTITSTMNIEFVGGETTIKDFYTTLNAEGVKYIVVSIGENKTETEDSFDPSPKSSDSADALLGDLDVLVVGSGGMESALQHFEVGSIVYTLDEFIELLGGKESEAVEGNVQIVDKYINTSTAGLIGNDPDNKEGFDSDEAGPNEFDANRLEFSFITSIYAVGDFAELEEPASKTEKELGHYLSNVYKDKEVPFFDITNGLGYIINPISSLSEATAESRFNKALSKELANIELATGEKVTYIEDTSFYRYVVNSPWASVWMHDSNDSDGEGSAQYLRSYDVTTGITTPTETMFEGTGLKFKPSGLVASLGDDLMNGGDAWVAAICGAIPDKEEPPKVYIVRTSSPIAYTQVKNGSWTNSDVATQEWNTLTGIPSTETFYISSGGSEFIIEMTSVEIKKEQAYRSYISHFASNDCKFKPGDTAQAGGDTTTATKKNFINHILNDTSVEQVVEDRFNLPAPTGNSSGNWTVEAHGGQTIWAQWTGTIENITSDPGVEGYVAEKNTLLQDGKFTSGTQGKMVPSGQEKDKGYSWSVDAYNTALGQAMDWARTYEEISNTEDGQITILSDSDRSVRTWHAGIAKITVTFGNMATSALGNEQITKAHTATDFSGPYTSSEADQTTLTLASNDTRLSSGWFENWGTRATFSCSGCTTLCGAHDQTDPIDMSNPEYYCEACKRYGNKSSYESSATYPYVTYAWDNNATSEDPGVIATNHTLSGHTLWCGCTWYSNSDKSSGWDNACNTKYHSHTTGGCDIGNCPHPTCTTDCCSKCAANIAHTEHNSDLCPHTAHETTCCSKVEHSHSSSCVTINNVTHEQVEHTHDNSNTNVVKTTTVKAPTVTYTIKVTFEGTYTNGIVGQDDSTAVRTDCPDSVYPAHSCCGPCCQHVLPAISDAWVQWIEYSSVRISDIRVNKISRSYVEGQNKTTLDFKNDTYLIGTVQEGDVNVFYNIATENGTYNNSLYSHHDGYGKLGGTSTSGELVVDGASVAGRLRHSVQSHQHDKVLWKEHNQLDETKRTSECDGQAATGAYNPVTDGGKGHEEKWALGILYRRSNSAGIAYYNGNAEKAEDYNTVFTHAKNAHWLTDNGTGAYDDAVRHVDYKKTGYSDVTVDERDKATFEYERFVERRETINTVNVLTDTLILQGTKNGDYRIMYASRSSAGKNTEMDHKIEDGLKITIDDVLNARPSDYLYEGAGESVDIPYDVLYGISNAGEAIFGGYNGNGASDELRTHSTLGSGKVTTLLDSNGSVYDATKKQTDPKADVQNPLGYSQPVTKNDSMNPEDFKSSSALLESRIERPSKSLRIGKLNIQIDPTMMNHQYITEKSTQTWFQIIKYTEPNAKGYYADGAADFTIGKEYFIANSNIGGADVFAQESYYYGTTSTGKLPPAHKVNDIIVHTPISSENNWLLQDITFVDGDQRAGKTLDNTVDKTDVCPGTSILCEHSYFDCSYLREEVLFNMHFDENYYRTDSNGKVTSGKTFAVDTYGYVTSIIDSANYIVVPVKAGYVSRITGGSYGTGINVNGTSLNIPLTTIGGEYITGTKIRLAIQGSFSNDTRVFESGNIVATMRTDGIKVTNGNATYIFYFNNATGYHNFVFTIDYDGLDGMELTVDGKNIIKSNGTPAPDELNVQFKPGDWADSMLIGERCKLYNIQIVHLPGTTECTDGCYDNKFQCQTTVNYLCDVPTKFTGTQLPHKFTASIEGTYLIELYDNKGDYRSEKIHLDKGESIYAYLGSLGYWSYSGTDKGYTTPGSESFIKKVQKTTAVNTSITVVDTQSVASASGLSKTYNLTAGVYRLNYNVNGNNGMYLIEVLADYAGQTKAVTISANASSTTTTISGASGYTQILTNPLLPKVTGKIDWRLDRLVDTSTYDEVLDFNYTQTTTTETSQKNITTQNTSIINSNDAGTKSVVLTPGVYYLEAISEEGKLSSGIYDVLTNKTLYYSNNGNAGHWINDTNSSTNTLVYAKTKVDPTYKYTAMTRVSYDDDGGNGYNCSMYTTVGEGTYVLCVGKYSDMYSLSSYKNGDSLGDINCYFYININGTNYSRHNSGAISFTVPAGQTYSVSCYTDDWEADDKIIDPYTAVYKAGNKEVDTPGQPGVYTTNTSKVKGSATGVATTLSARTRIIRLADLSGLANLTGVTYAIPTTSSISNVVATCSVTTNTVTSATVTHVVEEEVKTTFTNYVYEADTSQIILSNAGGVPIVLEYTGNVQSVTLEPGVYKLEAWGASGGGNVAGMVGEGGYTSGTVTLNKTTTLYVYVGQAGNRNISSSNAPEATFNGGGDGGRAYMSHNINANDYWHLGGSGGGATDIRVVDGLWNDEESLKSRLLVAGGGGGMGCASSHNPGHGGGLEGATTTNTGSYYGASATGGTQTSGGYGNGQFNYNNSGTWTACARAYGSFGTGSNAIQCGAGGGGGYYGGGSNYTAGGAGGSSYVSGYPSCDTTYLENQKVHGVNLQFSDVVMQQGGNIGNGRVRITKVGAAIGYATVDNGTQTFGYTGSVQEYVVPRDGYYKLEAWGASGGGSTDQTKGSHGGQGGYTAGTVYLTRGTKLFLYVGEAGWYTTAIMNDADGSWNGGGARTNSTACGSSTGGGASDIRLLGGTWDNDAGLKSRILVAGGGGGADDATNEKIGKSNDGSGGAGGGLVAESGRVNGRYDAIAAGGGQSSVNGTAFGKGESCNCATDTGAGGGGYYGGLASCNNNGGAGGGSSYVSGYTGCDTTYLVNQRINGKNLTFTDVVLQQGGNTGNGKICITPLSDTYNTHASDGYTWVKIFSHDTTGGFFTSEAEALHTGTPASKKYSILDEIDKLRTTDDTKYVFKLYYPETGQTNIWKQSFKPQDEYLADGNGTQQVRGYEAVSISMTGNYWGGLAKSTTSGHTFIDGSINHGNWFYAIGSYSQWGTGPITIPGGNSESITKVELYLATDTEKLAEGNMTSSDHIINSTVTTTTSCPVESPYYWFTQAAKTNVAQIRLIHETHTADCKKDVNTFNYHTHTTDCIGNTPAWDYLVYAALYDLPELDTLCYQYLGVSKASLGASPYDTIINKAFDLSKIPSSFDGHDNTILNCLNHNTEHVHTATCKSNNKTSICNNVHHKGEHNEFGHVICYEPCRDNEQHKPTKVEIDDAVHYIGTATHLNSYFSIYWDNYGDFFDTGDPGSLTLSSEKGQGYENNMDTTRWLKRKVIVFDDIDVLFYDETQGTWTMYRAGQEIELPIVTDGIIGNGDDDEKRNWRDKKQTPITAYPFYCLLNNNEHEKTTFQAWTEALNSPSSEGQGNKPYDKLRDRFYDITAKVNNYDRSGWNPTLELSYSALHSTKHFSSFDVVGQIGNLLITYTTDPRWSNFFKQANVEAGWQMENLLYEVHEAEQERYLYIGREKNGTFRDVRNNQITAQALYFDTWNTEAWKHQAVPINSILEPALLAAQTNHTWSKLATELKCGYDIYCEITTTGDYNAVEAEYKYFVFDKYTGEVSEVDLWSKVDSNYLAYYLADKNAAQIQAVIDQDSLKGYYGIESTKSLALYHLYIDLGIEQGYRMLTDEQIALTATISKTMDTSYIYEEVVVDNDGDIVTMMQATEVPGEGLSLVQRNIGTAYGVTSDFRSRVFVGSSYDNWGLRDYTAGFSKPKYTGTIMDTNLDASYDIRTGQAVGGSNEKIGSVEFTKQARRWLFTAGIAENTIAVKYTGGDHVDLTTQSTHENIIEDYDRYAILIGVNITARGNVWNLEYEAFDSPQYVLGRHLSTEYPDIIAVYGLNSKEDDFDVEQSH